MKIQTCLLWGVIALSNGSELCSMEPEPVPLSIEQKAQSCLYLKKFFLELSALASKDTLCTEEVLLTLLSTVRYEKLPEVFAFDKQTFIRFFKLKKLHRFFQHYKTRTTKERLQALTACIEWNELENSFKNSFLKKITSLFIELYCNPVDAVLEKKNCLQKLQLLIDETLKLSYEREQAGEPQENLITSYLDFKLLLKFSKALAKGKEISAERFLELFKGDLILKKSTTSLSTYTEYCSITKLINVLIRLIIQEEHQLPSCEELLCCLKWDSLAELVISELLEEEADLFIDKEELKKVMQRLQAGEEITGTELKALLKVQEIEHLLTLKGFSWDTCAHLLNQLRAGKLTLSEIKPLEKFFKMLELDIASALDATIPEAAQMKKVETVIHNCSSSDWFMRCKYALPFVGVSVGLWLTGHAVCHSCMEFIEPQSWYTAGPLALAVFYTTFRLGKFFTTPQTMKKILVNAAITKTARTLAGYYKESISKEDILSLVPDTNADRKMLFEEFIKLLTYSHLDALPRNRYDILTLWENPLLFMHSCTAFIELLFKKESYSNEEHFTNVLTLLYALLKTGVEDETLPYETTYTTLINQLGPLSQSSFESYLIPLIACYNPSLLLGQKAFIKTLTFCKKQINGVPLSAWLCTIIASYKEHLDKNCLNLVH